MEHDHRPPYGFIRPRFRPLKYAYFENFKRPKFFGEGGRGPRLVRICYIPRPLTKVHRNAPYRVLPELITEFKPKFAKIMGHFRGAKSAKIDKNIPILCPPAETRVSSLSLRKVSGEKLFFWFANSTSELFRPKKSRKIGEKIAKNSGMAPAWPVLEFKLRCGSRIAWHQKISPYPIGAEKLGGQILKFDPTFLGKGGSPTPEFYIVGKRSTSSIR